MERSAIMIRLLALILVLSGAQPLLAVEAGESAPDFSLPARNSTTLTLSAYRGKLVYLDFWASWCSSCRESIPWMNTLKGRVGADDFEIIAVNLDTRPSSAEELLEELGVTFPVVFDAKGETPERFAVEAMPSSYLIDRDGKVVSVFVGFSAEHRKQIESEIKKLLAIGEEL